MTDYSVWCPLPPRKTTKIAYISLQVYRVNSHFAVENHWFPWENPLPMVDFPHLFSWNHLYLQLVKMATKAFVKPPVKSIHRNPTHPSLIICVGIHVASPDPRRKTKNVALERSGNRQIAAHGPVPAVRPPGGNGDGYWLGMPLLGNCICH